MDLHFNISPCQDYKPVEKFCRNLHENRPETDPNENLKSGFERSSARNLGKFGRELRSPIAMQCITLVFKIFFTQRDEEELIADVLTTLEILLQGYPKLIQFTNRAGFFYIYSRSEKSIPRRRGALKFNVSAKIFISRNFCFYKIRNFL